MGRTLARGELSAGRLLPLAGSALPIDGARLGIFGHSMAGMARSRWRCATRGLQSLSASHHLRAHALPWGVKAFTGYLGPRSRRAGARMTPPGSHGATGTAPHPAASSSSTRAWPTNSSRAAAHGLPRRPCVGQPLTLTPPRGLRPWLLLHTNRLSGITCATAQQPGRIASGVCNDLHWSIVTGQDGAFLRQEAP